MKLSSQLICIAISLLPLTTASLAAEKPEWDQQRPNDMPIEKWNTLKATVTSGIKLTAEDGAAGDLFGVSVSTSGDRALIGASFDDNDNGINSGSAYVYKFDGINWVEEEKLINSDGASSDWFGVSVSLLGDRALIGAYGDDGNATNSGSAYVFKFDGINWVEEQKLTASDGASNDYFGSSVNLSEDRALIGAYGDDDAGFSTGSTYAFEYNGVSWQEEQKLTASDMTSGDKFGYSVSISGDRALIGAHGDDDNGSNSGSVYVFEYNGVSWQESQKFIASDGAANDWFGISISQSGDRALIGASLDVNGTNSGSAYVFEHNGISWQESQKLTASDGTTGDQFGNSVSLFGDRALIGAYLDDGPGGSAYVFEYNGASWQESQKLAVCDRTTDDQFGNSVSISVDWILIGGFMDNENGTESGSAYVLTNDGSSVELIFCDGFD